MGLIQDFKQVAEDIGYTLILPPVTKAHIWNIIGLNLGVFTAAAGLGLQSSALMASGSMLTAASLIRLHYIGEDIRCAPKPGQP